MIFLDYGIGLQKALNLTNQHWDNKRAVSRNRRNRRQRPSRHQLDLRRCRQPPDPDRQRHLCRGVLELETLSFLLLIEAKRELK